MSRCKFRPIVIAALVLFAGQDSIAQAGPTTGQVQELDPVAVTGIRASILRSMETKRDADTNVDVISAEDVGKMSDKNMAEALSRVVGVNAQYGGASAMDEAERVSIRGTAPSLNLITVNGHALSAGDWHVGDQQASNSVSSRSIGFGLLPSQLIGQSVVYKTQRADITEGGLTGSVDVMLRKPLDFSQPFGGELSFGTVYSDLPANAEPQFSGIVSAQNDDKTLGFMLQGFKEARSLRREGMETLGYTGALTAAQVGNQTNLIGLRMPSMLNSALFEGERKRDGGYSALQFRPNRDLDITLSVFRSHLRAENYNSSAYSIASNLLNNGWQLQDVTVNGDTISSAKLVRPANAPGSQQVIGMQFEHLLRQGATSDSSFNDIDVMYRLNERLKSRVRLGTTDGNGSTPSEPSIYTAIINPNMQFSMTPDRPAAWTMLDSTGKSISLADINSWKLVSGAGPAVFAKDKENYLNLDWDYNAGFTWMANLKFGVRSSKHEHSVDNIAARYYAQDGANGTPLAPAAYGTVVTGGTLLPFAVPTPAALYPANYAGALNSAFPRDAFRFDPAQLQAFADKYMYWDPVTGKNWAASYNVQESSTAAYFMNEFSSGAVSGNAGLRYVQTKEDTVAYQLLPSGTAAGQCTALQACSVSDSIVGSAFGTYVPQMTSATHRTWLPSLNLRWDIDSELVGRFAASRSMGRANYNEMAAAVNLDNTRGTGTTGNPYIKPILSTNLDTSIAWYFAPKAYISGAIFSADIQNYVKPRTARLTFIDTTTGLPRDYDVSTRDGVSAFLRGYEIATELPVGRGFGIGANVTYVESSDADGQPMLGTSKYTYNLIGFYEDRVFSARLAWNYRDDYAYNVVGDGSGVPTRNAGGNITAYNGLQYFKGYGSLSVSLGYKLTDRLSLTLDGNNLNDPVRHTYLINENAPANWYVSGRQYYLNLRMKL